MSGLALIVIPIVDYISIICAVISDRQLGVMAHGDGGSARVSPGFFDGLLALAVALIVSLPWFVFMLDRHGWQVVAALRLPPTNHDPLTTRFAAALIDLAPVTLPLGLFGAVRAVRLALVSGFNTLETIGGSLWVIWLGLASLAPTVLAQRSSRCVRFGLARTTESLAAQTIADLVNRRVSVRI